MTGAIKPRFAHDCAGGCMFLGHYKEHDLYAHPARHATVIARWGNAGPDYLSGVAIAERVEDDHPLAEALRRAQQQGIAV